MMNILDYEGKFLETVNDDWYRGLVGSVQSGANWSQQAVQKFDGEKYKYGDHYGVVLYKENGFVFGIEFGTVLGYRDKNQNGFHVLRKRRAIDECVPFVPEKPKSKMKGKEFLTTNAPPLGSQAANKNDGEQTIIEDNSND